MIYVTHDQVEAMTMAEKIVVVNAGKIEQVGKPLDLFERPANRFVAEFIGSPKMNMFKSKITNVSDSGIEVTSNTIDHFCIPVASENAKIGDSVTLGVRPSHIEIAESGIPLEITQLECMGHETFIYGSIKGESEDLVAHLPHHFEAEIGDTIYLRFSSQFMHVFCDKTDQAFKRIES